jgi:hypothetical protein
MTQTRALEHKGVLYVVEKPKDVKELWFIAKSDCNEPLAKIWTSMKKYGCEYDANVMKMIGQVESNLYVQRLLI